MNRNKNTPAFNRRRFLGATAAATVGGMLLPGVSNAGPIRETEHFWFRRAPEGPYIDSQRDHKAFGFDNKYRITALSKAGSFTYDLKDTTGKVVASDFKPPKSVVISSP